MIYYFSLSYMILKKRSFGTELFILFLHILCVEPGLTHDLFPCNVSYVGRLFVKGTGKPSEILTRLNEMAGYDPEEDIVLYEVGLYYFLYFSHNLYRI